MIELARGSATLDAYRSALNEQGAEASEALAASLWRLVQKLRPGAMAADAAAAGALSGPKVTGDPHLDQLAKSFPALAKPDHPIWEKHAADAAAANELENKRVADQTIAELEGLLHRGPASDAAGKRPRSPSPGRRSGGDRERGRSRSPRGDRREHDDRGRPSRWEPRQGGAGPSGGGGGGGGVDDEPIVHKIYTGKVSGVRDFGAFVTLEGIRGRREGATQRPHHPPSMRARCADARVGTAKGNDGCGQWLGGMLGLGPAGLIHLSQLIVGGRINDPNEVIKRSQVVKVKVLSVAGTRISLSLKEVDQRTGADLAPRAARPDDVCPPPPPPLRDVGCRGNDADATADARAAAGRRGTRRRRYTGRQESGPAQHLWWARSGARRRKGGCARQAAVVARALGNPAARRVRRARQEVPHARTPRGPLPTAAVAHTLAWQAWALRVRLMTRQ